MKKTLIIILLLLNFSGYSQSSETGKKVDWNGYTQLRATSNFDDYSSLMVRRLKFWLKSTPAFSHHWSYKIQGVFTSKMQERLFLQDVKISYKTGLFSLDFGQFVPAYSLEWTQPDYRIPTLERSNVINALHTDGSLGVRDLGVQLNYHSKNKIFETHLGVFNGYGIKQYRFNNSGFMLSHKTAYNMFFNYKKLQIGYSFQYRKADKMKIPKVLLDTIYYSGNDVRYNLFARYESQKLQLQAEYLTAYLNDDLASGYYLLSSYHWKKNQIVASYEFYKDLIKEPHHPYYHLGYNYLIHQNKIKLFLDNSFQVIDGKIDNYTASMQLQIFFN